MKTRVFTAGIIVRGDDVLVMKRKMDDDTYPGLWDCAGGHFEDGESAEECMLREAREETGLKTEIARIGNLIEYRDEYGRSLAVPFLLRSPSGPVKLSEHSESRWLSAADARKLRSVPCLRIAVDGFGI